MPQTDSKLRKINLQTIYKFRRALLKWYKNHGRRFQWRKKFLSKYRILTCEILLQRTRADTVESFYDSFYETFPAWTDLANARISFISSSIRSIGLYRQRSAVLKNLAIVMLERGGRVPRSYDELEKLPGVGQYIANATMLLCWSKPYPLLDVNMARVLERVFGKRKLADIRYDPYLQELAKKVVRLKKCRELNWAILDIAALYCSIKKPRCVECPLIYVCRYSKGCSA